MTDLSQLNYLAIAVAALSTFFLGSLWYAPFLFGKVWMTENNFTEEDLKNGMGRILTSAFILEAIMAFNLAAFIGTDATLTFGMIAGFAAGFGWVALGMGVTYLFDRKSFRHWAIDASYHTVAFTMMGAILGAW